MHVHLKSTKPHSHAAEKRNLKCDLCPESFELKSALNNHIDKVHESWRPFQCQTCNTGFRSRPELIVHVKVVHEGQKPFECDQCKEAFATRGAVKWHNLRYHQKIQPVQCKICQKSFKMLKNLKQHSKTHLETSFHKSTVTKLWLDRKGKRPPTGDNPSLAEWWTTLSNSSYFEASL